MRHSGFTSFVAVVVLVLLAGCGGQRSQQDTESETGSSCTVSEDVRFSMASGDTTGVYYTLGTAYAEAVAAATNGKLEIAADATSNSIQNIWQLASGEYQIAFSRADAAADAVEGKGSFDSPQPIAALSRLYSNYTHVIVRTSSGINSIADMRGKRVSIGAPNSGTEVIAAGLLRAAGLNSDTDIEVQRIDLASAVEEMKEGSIDALFWSGGLPTSGITDLVTTDEDDEIKFLDIAGLLDAMQKISSTYERGVIPESVYDTPEDVPTIVVPNVLLVKADMDDDTACVLTKVLFEYKADLVKATRAAEGISVDMARDTSPVPLRPGAEEALDALGAPN